ncbi:hypothetical protein EVAR_94391_1 [Eumeta japonica]|uniref:Uncharacterized protein n=1 Tax=Eumeta variegata TaxID=151549 RepID=A0A4C1TPZ7_EUMVA|nr:hypothetical protein EVAR_94391_1 [Eumeta japonica]
MALRCLRKNNVTLNNRICFVSCKAHVTFEPQPERPPPHKVGRRKHFTTFYEIASEVRASRKKIWTLRAECCFNLVHFSDVWLQRLTPDFRTSKHRLCHEPAPRRFLVKLMALRDCSSEIYGAGLQLS